MRALAAVISYVLHPLWTPLIMLGLLWCVDPWLRLQLGLVAGEEIPRLVLHDGLHRDFQGVPSLVDGVDEPLGRIDLALDEGDGLLLRPVRLVGGGVAGHHLPVFVGHPQLRSVPAIDVEAELIALHGHLEIGHHGLDGTG